MSSPESEPHAPSAVSPSWGWARGTPPQLRIVETEPLDYHRLLRGTSAYRWWKPLALVWGGCVKAPRDSVVAVAQLRGAHEVFAAVCARTEFDPIDGVCSLGYRTFEREVAGVGNIDVRVVLVRGDGDRRIVVPFSLRVSEKPSEREHREIDAALPYGKGAERV